MVDNIIVRSVNNMVIKGSPMDQQELEMNTKRKLLSYPEMADVSLKTVGTETKLSNPNPGMVL